MSWFGKMVGGTIGLMMGGPLGAIAGGAIGHHLFDKEHPGTAPHGDGAFGGGRTMGGDRPLGGGFSRTTAAEQRQMTFFLALFSILGKLAKADGQVTREEGEQVVAFLDQMNVHGQQRSFAIRVFNEAKDSPYRVEDFARQFAEFSRGRHDLRSSMMDMLFRIALADGQFHPAEDAMIASVAGVLGISNQELQAIRERYVATTHQAYATLGISPDADDDEVKSAYRKLVQEHHPDRIVSEGMPEEFVKYATTRFQEIQDAWQKIRTERGL
ncbi:MAG: TerB family tellurite resistance protein [Alkalispirochaeta sp.]